MHTASNSASFLKAAVVIRIRTRQLYLSQKGNSVFAVYPTHKITLTDTSRQQYARHNKSVNGQRRTCATTGGKKKAKVCNVEHTLHLLTSHTPFCVICWSHAKRHMLFVEKSKQPHLLLYHCQCKKCKVRCSGRSYGLRLVIFYMFVCVCVCVCVGVCVWQREREREKDLVRWLIPSIGVLVEAVLYNLFFLKDGSKDIQTSELHFC